MSKNIVIATKDFEFNSQLSKLSTKNGFSVLDTIVVIELFISSLKGLKNEGHKIDGVLISSSLAKSSTEGKRLEMFADVVYTVRQEFPEVTFVVLSDEVAGHPLLGELVSLGIYNIIERNNKEPLKINQILALFETSKTFADASVYRNVDKGIVWRNQNSGYSGAQTVIANEVASKPTVIEKEVIVEREKIVEKEKIVKQLVREEVIVEKIREIKVSPKTIVIASAYQGAGSSFVSIILSRILSEIGISNAVVEHPYVQPELYALLNGNEKLPNKYSFLHERLGSNHLVSFNDVNWTDKNTTYYPLNPEGIGDKDEWLKDNTIRMLYQINEPIVIIDVSHHLNEEDVYETCLSADHIFFVVDTSLPIKYFSEVTKANTKTMFDLEKLNKRVHIVANRDVDIASREEWLSSLPQNPIAVIPNISPEIVIDAQWNNKYVTDHVESADRLTASLFGVLKFLVPKDFNVSHIKKKKGNLIGKLFRR